MRGSRREFGALGSFIPITRDTQIGEKGTVGRLGEAFRVTDYSVQSTHWHLTVEAAGDLALRTCTRGLKAHSGNALRALSGVTGSSFTDRYHLEIVTSPTRMRIELRCVLNNTRQHGSWTKDAPDPYSSGPWFGGRAAGGFHDRVRR